MRGVQIAQGRDESPSSISKAFRPAAEFIQLSRVSPPVSVGSRPVPKYSKALRHEVISVVAMSQRSAGLKWFRATHPERIDGKVRVSHYYPPGKSTWKPEQPTWAFEFPLKDLKSAVAVTYCVCESKDGGSFYCLRVPHQHVLDHRAALYERIDKSGRPSIGVFLAASPAAKFRDVRATGGVDFGQFLLRVDVTS